MKCINCDLRAMFEYKISKVESILYCGKCLPSFLNDRKKAGLLTITEEYKEDQASALKALAPETTDLEEIPKKKAASKKSDK
jgi:hypothetical protein